MGTLATEVGRMNTGLRGLKSRLAEVLEYLQLVGSGKLPVNHDIIYDLQVCSVRVFCHTLFATRDGRKRLQSGVRSC